MMQHYAAVLSDLRTRKSQLESELAKVEAAITALQPLIESAARFIGATGYAVSTSYGQLAQAVLRPRRAVVTDFGDPPLAASLAPMDEAVDAPTPAVGTDKEAGKYAHMSMRWAVLRYFAEFSTGAAKTGEIAKALQEGGYVSNAGNFGNKVSAVLSNMKAKQEVQVDAEGNYSITAMGRATWEVIERGEKFRMRASSTEQSLLAVQ